MNHIFATKVSFITVCKGEISVHDQLFCRHQLSGNLHGVTRKLDLDETSVSILKDKFDETHFSVRPRDFLHPSLINYALYVVIILVLVCLCRFLWQIVLLTYTSYELVAHFDLSLDLFLGDF